MHCPSEALGAGSDHYARLLPIGFYQGEKRLRTLLVLSPVGDPGEKDLLKLANRGAKLIPRNPIVDTIHRRGGEV